MIWPANRPAESGLQLPLDEALQAGHRIRVEPFPGDKLLGSLLSSKLISRC